MSTHTSGSDLPSSVTPAGAVERVHYARLWKVGALALAAAVAANLIVYALAVALIEVSPAFLPLSNPSPTIIFTALGAVAAVVVFALVGRWSRRPRRTYLIIASVALLVSLFPNVMMLLDPASAPFEGITTAGVLVLMLQHVLAAVVIVWVLLRGALETSFG